MKISNFVIAAFFIFIITGCAEKTVSTKPDVVVVERPSPPHAGAVWVDNEYAWRRGSYVIVPGHWVRRAGVWVPGHWVPARRGYRWVPGHWR